MSVTGTIPAGTPSQAPQAPAEAPSQVAAPEAPIVATNPDPDSKLKDLSFLVDESDLPAAGQRHGLSPRLEAMLNPTPDGQPPVTNQSAQPQPETKPGETAQQKAERLYAQKYHTPEELEQGYLEAQRLMTEKAMQYAELRNALGENDPRVIQDLLRLRQWHEQQWKPWAAAYNAKLQQQGSTQEAAQPTEDTAPRPKSFLQMGREELLDAFSEDPQKALIGFFQELITSKPEIVEAGVPELAQSRAAERIIRDFVALEQQFPDAAQFLPAMEKLYAQYPSLRTQYPMVAVYKIAKGEAYDQLLAGQQQAVQSAAEIATKTAYDNQAAKVQGTVEGAMSIEPGQGGARDDIAELMEWNRLRQVKVV